MNKLKEIMDKLEEIDEIYDKAFEYLKLVFGENPSYSRNSKNLAVDTLYKLTLIKRGILEEMGESSK
ncbi:hypothetical protein [uncultured Streptococcus sp.]|uniref:hypothetical protein n=1 Tax=uncultured Streptococcus sp. TaxID=83427 RepID=UPI00260AB875|nr:hypothetical protein [uncultured Streptococcus sp.]